MLFQSRLVSVWTANAIQAGGLSGNSNALDGWVDWVFPEMKASVRILSGQHQLTFLVAVGNVSAYSGQGVIPYRR